MSGGKWETAYEAAIALGNADSEDDIEFARLEARFRMAVRRVRLEDIPHDDRGAAIRAGLEAARARDVRLGRPPTGESRWARWRMLRKLGFRNKPGRPPADEDRWAQWRMLRKLGFRNIKKDALNDGGPPLDDSGHACEQAKTGAEEAQGESDLIQAGPKRQP